MVVKFDTYSHLVAISTSCSGTDTRIFRPTAKKEDRDAFLARTQAQRQARQHSKHMDVAAVRIQSMYRRHQAISAARVIMRAHFDEHLSVRDSIGWDNLSSLLRVINFIYLGNATISLSCDDIKRFGAAFECLHRSVDRERGQSFILDGLIEKPSVLYLQLQRMCALAVQFLGSARYGVQTR